MTHPDYFPKTTDKHRCYFCTPNEFPAMPEGKTLCARCGDMIDSYGSSDPMNEAMWVCQKCNEEIGEILRDEAD